MIYVTGIRVGQTDVGTTDTYFEAKEYLAALRRQKETAVAESFAALSCLAKLLESRGILPGVRLVRDTNGRPCLPDCPGLDFSVTHSHGIAFCALSDGGRVGIDAEKLRDFPSASRLAARFFAPAEQNEEFFRVWTRKEAYLKYLGTGFSADGIPDGIAALDTTGLGHVLFTERDVLSCRVTVCSDPDQTVVWQVGDPGQ